ncbi:DegT/DnrJ/EryC1/StrS family aminotransferase [Lentzea sp. JNUCC 0626]|uniref:DegT/DnrJ/EryC1/StrS family aminotransferase n=1 Tax=Lentzea sp. JNUCC 0626 TaxID=3367513 RepID=UPI0037486A83
MSAEEVVLAATLAYHRASEQETRFVPGQTPVLTGGAVVDAEDRVALVRAALGLKVVAGAHTREFESGIARKLGLRKALTVNSGASANLVAISSLTSPVLGDRALQAGDEVITAAAGSPTIVIPIIQNGLVPVFVDVELGTCNATAEAIEAAIGPRTKAIALAHTLGNPFDAAAIARLARDRNLWLVEDNRDGLGSTLNGRLTGTFGDVSTLGFSPAHHITTGDGGACVTSNPRLAGVMESLRHNLKSTDLNAALGVTQLGKLDRFADARRRNWQLLRDGLEDVPGLVLPVATEHSDPAWSGFLLTLDPSMPFSRTDLVRFLDDRKIATRLVGGTLLRRPEYRDVEHRVSGSLANSDLITERTFWLGTHPQLTEEMIDYVTSSIRTFVQASARIAA